VEIVGSCSSLVTAGNSRESLAVVRDGDGGRLIGGVQCESISHEVQHVQPTFQQDEQARG